MFTTAEAKILIRNGELPSPNQIIRLFEAIDARDAEIERLNAEILQLRTSLSSANHFISHMGVHG